MQTGLLGHPAIKLRIGAHISEIVEHESDFYGAGVNLAARLQTEAPPGGLMVSEDFHRQLTGELSLMFDDASTFKLKNIALPVNADQWRPQTENSRRSSDVPTIAVEAFELAPDNLDTRAAAVDLRDQLILRLSKRTGVRILDEGTGQPTESIFLLRGRLRMAGERGRFNLALLLRDGGENVLSQSYEGDTTDIFAFCDKIIEQADIDLRLQINAFDVDRISHLPDDELSVSELRPRAASEFYKVTVASWARGVFGVHTLRDSISARRDLERTIALNSAYPPAWEYLGLVEMLEGNFDQAARHLEQSISMSDSDPHAHAIVLSCSMSVLLRAAQRGRCRH